MTLHEQLRRDEGVRRKPYQDTLGIWTWGVGHNLEVPLSHQVIALLAQGDVDGAIEETLGEDIAHVRGQLIDLMPWYLSLSDARRGVLENLGFIGIGTLLSFRKMLAHCMDGEWDQAAAALVDSRLATQVGDRAQRLATQLREDRWV